MTKEERELSIEYLEGMKEAYIEGEGFERHPLPEYFAIEIGIKALEQESKTWSLDDARDDFMHDVYETLDFLPTNNEANQIISSFDRVTSGLKPEPNIDKPHIEGDYYDGFKNGLRTAKWRYSKIREEIEKNAYPIVYGVNSHEKGMTLNEILQVIDKYMAESEEA